MCTRMHAHRPCMIYGILVSRSVARRAVLATGTERARVRAKCHTRACARAPPDCLSPLLPSRPHCCTSLFPTPAPPTHPPIHPCHAPRARRALAARLPRAPTARRRRNVQRLRLQRRWSRRRGAGVGGRAEVQGCPPQRRGPGTCAACGRARVLRPRDASRVSTFTHAN